MVSKLKIVGFNRAELDRSETARFWIGSYTTRAVMDLIGAVLCRFWFGSVHSASAELLNNRLFEFHVMVVS